jgi:hypothetical protein
MGAKTSGPLLEDYKRAIKAAKWAGWKVVRVEIGSTGIALLADDTYLQQLSLGQHPAPDLKAAEKPKKHNW